MLFTAGDIAERLGGTVLGDRTMPLTGFQAADRAGVGDLTFAENRTVFVRAERSAASAIIIEKSFTSERKVLIRVSSARLAFAKVVPLFYPEPGPPTGIHPSAIISDKAEVHPEACIGARRRRSPRRCRACPGRGRSCRGRRSWTNFLSMG